MRSTLSGADFFKNGVELFFHRCRETGEEQRRHAHNFLEIAYVAKGHAKHHVGRIRYEILAGDIFVVNSYEPHSYVGKNNLEIWYVLVGLQMLGKHLADLKRVPGFLEFFWVEPAFRQETRFDQHLHLNSDATRRIECLLQRMEGELARREPGYAVLLESLLMDLFVTISRLYHGFSREHIDAVEMDSKKKAVRDVVGFIETNYAEDIHLSDLARHGCLQSEYLCRVFKKATGMTMIEYLTHVRIQKACELLVSTSEPVTNICYMTGFHDLSYFIRTFRKIIGDTPSRFREASPSARQRTGHPDLASGWRNPP